MKIERILIIEDSEADQFYSKKIIGFYDQRIEIFQAFDGKEALDVLSKMHEKPDVIFLDVNMPIMNGLEFLENYNRMACEKSAVFILTSSENRKDIDQAMSYDFVRHYFIKSLTQEHLAFIRSL